MGFRAVSAPVIDNSGVCRGAISVVYAGPTDLDALGDVVCRHARELGAEL